MKERRVRGFRALDGLVLLFHHSEGTSHQYQRTLQQREGRIWLLIYIIQKFPEMTTCRVRALLCLLSRSHSHVWRRGSNWKPAEVLTLSQIVRKPSREDRIYWLKSGVGGREEGEQKQPSKNGKERERNNRWDGEKQQHHKATLHSRGELIFAAAMIRWESWGSSREVSLWIKIRSCELRLSLQPSWFVNCVHCPTRDS